MEIGKSNLMQQYQNLLQGVQNRTTSVSDAVDQFRLLEDKAGAYSPGGREIDPGPLRQLDMPGSTKLFNGLVEYHFRQGEGRNLIDVSEQEFTRLSGEPSSENTLHYKGLSFLKVESFNDDFMEDRLKANNSASHENRMDPYQILEKYVSRSVDNYATHQSIEGLSNQITDALNSQGIAIKNISSVTIDKQDNGQFKVHEQHPQNEAIETVLNGNKDINDAMDQLWEKAMTG